LSTNEASPPALVAVMVYEPPAVAGFKKTFHAVGFFGTLVKPQPS
jgi:hypothetical protein